MHGPHLLLFCTVSSPTLPPLTPPSSLTLRLRLKKDEAEAALIEAKTPKDQPDPDVVAFKAFVMSGFRATKVHRVPARGQ